MPKKQIPDTSKEAFKSLIPEKIGEMYLVIMGALYVLQKATFEDIATHLKIEKSRVWKRLSEMERLQLIYRPGTKKVLKSGRMGYEWALTVIGSPKTDKKAKNLKNKPTVQDHSRKIQDIQQKIKQLKLL